MPFVYNKDRKGAIRIANGSPNYQLLNQKSNLTLVRAVAFLMFFFNDYARYHDTDNANNSINYRDNGFNDTQHL